MTATVTPEMEAIQILADAVNQLAIVVEHLAFRTVHEIGTNDYRWAQERCHVLRNNVADLIPDEAALAVPESEQPA